MPHKLRKTGGRSEESCSSKIPSLRAALIWDGLTLPERHACPSTAKSHALWQCGSIGSPAACATSSATPAAHRVWLARSRRPVPSTQTRGCLPDSSLHAAAATARIRSLAYPSQKSTPDCGVRDTSQSRCAAPPSYQSQCDEPPTQAHRDNDAPPALTENRG